MPETKPRYGYYLSVGPNPNGPGLLAVMSDGQPQLGHASCEILTVEVLKDRDEAEAWFERMKLTRPWEPRH